MAICKNKKWYDRILTSLVKNWMSLIGIILLSIVFTILSQVKYGTQYFMTWDNWRTILIQTSSIAIVAIGQAVIMITGNFDLSLGRLVCLTSCIGAVLMKTWGVALIPSILIMFLVGILVGCLNGFLTAYIGIPALITTLGTQYICYGVAKLITNASPISRFSSSLSWLGQKSVGDFLPICVLIMVFLYLIVQVIMGKTTLGRNLYAVGSSPEAAFFSGIHVKRYLFGVFVFGAIIATFGGLVLMSRLDSVAVTNGQNYEFDAVIGSIIGGISLSGGKGRVIGTMFGCIFLTILFNGFSQMGIDSFVQDVLKGCVLVLAITLDVVSNRKAKA